jgi:23S rRNA pseudouridine1911/1915/1917 synthase
MSLKDFNLKIKSVTTPLPGSIPYTSNYKLSVKLIDDGKTLLELYQSKFPHIDQEIWLNKIEKGTLTVNGNKSTADQILIAGWMTENVVKNKTEPHVNNDIELVYEDDDIIVVNKPAPLPIHPSGRFNKNSLTEILKLAFPNETFKVIHRLDANTTGLLILGKNNKSVTLINKQFESNSIQKTYLALVEGNVEKNKFTVTTKIGEDKTTSGSRLVSENGQTAETNFEVIERLDNQTLLKVTPKSGRTNQIRVHLASINHPIVGDFGYKDSTYFENNPLTYSKDCLFLHAWKLSIFHNGTEKQFIANIPKKFSKKISII